jgi:predicted dehydrogenase
LTDQRLGIGVIGSGFNARFHLQAFQAVRDADVLGVWSPKAQHAEETAGLARRLDVGAAKPYRSIAAMVADPAIDALWLCGPNYARIENVEEIADTVTRAKGELRGIACEKPLGRTVAEAKRVTALVEQAGRRSRPPSPTGGRSSGRAARRSLAGPISPAPPRSTAAPTCRGFGGASSRGAAFSTT